MSENLYSSCLVTQTPECGGWRTTPRWYLLLGGAEAPADLLPGDC